MRAIRRANLLRGVVLLLLCAVFYFPLRTSAAPPASNSPMDLFDSSVSVLRPSAELLKKKRKKRKTSAQAEYDRKVKEISKKLELKAREERIIEDKQLGIPEFRNHQVPENFR